MDKLLAQRIVEFPFEWWCSETRAGPRQALLVQGCVNSLRIPWEGGNHIVLPHRALGPVYAAEAESKSVAIYHFDAHSFAAAEIIGSTGRRRRLMALGARPPGPRCFFEWPVRENDANRFRRDGRYGLYVEGDREGAAYMLWSEYKENPPIPCIAGRFKLASDGLISVARPLALLPAFSSDPQAMSAEEQGNWVHIILMLWTFLASQGAVVISREPAPRGSGKEYRSKSPGAAILSFNRVRLLVPKGLILRSDTVEWERGAGVRRHEVLAHPHCYWVGPREQRSLVVRWIAAYWRGNARLGLVLKARDVKTNGDNE